MTVEPTVHTVPILPATAGENDEPTSTNLIASLVHPERTGIVWPVAFSPDGARLFGAGYLSRIVQVWDVASRNDLMRIDLPSGCRISPVFPGLAPDWQTLFVPYETQSVKRFERDGSVVTRVDYSGAIRSWDIRSGQEKTALHPTSGTAPTGVNLSPDGKTLVSIERSSYTTADGRPKYATVVWDLNDGKKRKLIDKSVHLAFSRDGKTVVARNIDHERETSTVMLLDLSTGKELARVKAPDRGCYFSVAQMSPDGSVVAIPLYGEKGGSVEVWFLDARTLEDRGKLVGDGRPDGNGLSVGEFTPDGKRFVELDGVGNALVWDVAGRKLERTLALAAEEPPSRMAISADGKMLAAGWLPKVDPEFANDLEPDPANLPQPHVSLVDLNGKLQARVLIAPNGRIGGLALSHDGKFLALGSSGAVRLFDLTR